MLKEKEIKIKIPNDIFEDYPKMKKLEKGLPNTIEEFVEAVLKPNWDSIRDFTRKKE